MSAFLVIVDDLDVLGTGVCPSEYDSPLIIDPDRVPARQAASKSLQSVSWWHGQVVQHDSIVQLDQFPTRDLGERLWKALGNLPFSKNRFREPPLEASDHAFLRIIS